MKRYSLIVFSFFAVLLAACGTQTQVDTPNAATTPDVAASPAAELPLNFSVEEVAALRNDPNVVIVDVREQYEFDDGHIPNASLIPLGTLPDRLSEIPRDKTVIAVCRSGNRSSQATELLRSQGFDNVHNMTGGMNEWQAAGYPVE